MTKRSHADPTSPETFFAVLKLWVLLRAWLIVVPWSDVLARFFQERIVQACYSAEAAVLRDIDQEKRRRRIWKDRP